MGTWGTRPDAARHHDAGRRDALRRARVVFSASALVLAVDGFDGGHWALPCELPRACANRHSSYSPPEFRGRAIAIFHMNQVLLLLGGMLIGALSAAIGAPWAAMGR